MLRPIFTALTLAAFLAGSLPSFAAPKKEASRQTRARDDVTKIGSRDIDGIDVLNYFTREQELRLGRRLARQYCDSSDIVSDPLIAEYVNRLGQNLGRNSDFKGVLDIKVVRNEEINAGALPGGFFFVNTGLIQFAASEAELAGVMGHEIAHIAGRHGTRKVSGRIRTALLVQAVTDAIGSRYGYHDWKLMVGQVVAGAVLGMTHLKFSRTFEKKADLLGVQYIYAAGYDPLAMVSFFERLSSAEKATKRRISPLFLSHPLSSKRVKLVQKAIAEFLPAKPDYKISGNEFDEVQARIAELYGEPPTIGNKPQLRRRTIRR